MKLKEMIKHLQKIDQEYPENDFDVVYSTDDEGNGYNFIHYTPTIGHFDEHELEFKSSDSYDCYDLYPTDGLESLQNAVCIN